MRRGTSSLILGALGPQLNQHVMHACRASCSLTSYGGWDGWISTQADRLVKPSIRPTDQPHKEEWLAPVLLKVQAMVHSPSGREKVAKPAPPRFRVSGERLAVGITHGQAVLLCHGLHTNSAFFW
jgi:hypothetical protein